MKLGPERKEFTSWPSVGSKGVGWKVSAGGLEVLVGVDFFPVILSQIDIFAVS